MPLDLAVLHGLVPVVRVQLHRLVRRRTVLVLYGTVLYKNRRDKRRHFGIVSIDVFTKLRRRKDVNTSYHPFIIFVIVFSLDCFLLDFGTKK